MALNPKPTYSNVARIKIEGLVLDKDPTLGPLLGGCWIDCSMNLPTAFHLLFNDNYQQMLKASNAGEILSLGAKVEIFLIANGQGKDLPLMTGEITGIETDVDGPTTSTVIRGLDHAFKMMQHRRTKSYPEMTATEIVRILAAQDGVMVGPDVEPSSVRYKMITQPNISDWQFVCDLASRNGMYVDFDNRGLLRFRKLPRPTVPVNPAFPEMPTVLQVGDNAKRCRVGITASDQVTLASVRGWDVEDNRELKSESSTEVYRGRDIPDSPVDAVGKGKIVTYVETRTPYGSLGEVKQAASALAEDIGSVFAELEVYALGNPALMPGQTVELRNAGAKFDGFYTVTTARHEFTPGGNYNTLVTVTGHQVRNLYGLAAGASGSSERIHGVVNAIVTDIDDDRQQGRVKVKFPWLDDTYTTRWARTLQFGGHGGGVISPAVNDEVLVAFDRGDIDYPYVLGGLYGHELNKPSEHDTPLITAPGHLNRQSLVSRAGHRLELLDSDDVVPRRGVRLQSGDKALTVFLDQTKTEITVTSNGEISIQGKAAVSVSSDKSISIKAPKVSIEGKVNVQGPMTVDGAVNLIGDLGQAGGDAKFDTGLFTVNAVATSIDSAGVVAITAVGDVNLKGAAVTSEPFPV